MTIAGINQAATAQSREMSVLCPGRTLVQDNNMAERHKNKYGGAADNLTRRLMDALRKRKLQMAIREHTSTLRKSSDALAMGRRKC